MKYVAQISTNKDSKLQKQNSKFVPPSKMEDCFIFSIENFTNILLEKKVFPFKKDKSLKEGSNNFKRLTLVGDRLPRLFTQEK